MERYKILQECLHAVDLHEVGGLLRLNVVDYNTMKTIGKLLLDED